MDDEATVGPARKGRESKEAPKRLAGRYDILALLGVGGMGSVFLANDTELGDRIALKMLKRTDDGAALQRFRDEVRLARRVTHRNVARTYDIGEHDGEKFLTMEYVEGESLSNRLRRSGPLPMPEIKRIALALCDGLAAAHAAGVIHRDLKPGNVMLGNDGRVVITDFGLAARSRTTEDGVVGTIAYMAPEQFAGGATDERTDIYALGAMIYRMATGHRPFDLLPPMRGAAPDPCERRAALPPEFGRIVVRCLAADPMTRFESAGVLAEALGAVAVPAEDDLEPVTRRFEHVDERMIRSIALVSETEGDAPRAIRTAIIDCLARNPVLRVSDEPREAEATIALRVDMDGGNARVRLRASTDGIEFWTTTCVDEPSKMLELAATVARRLVEALALDLPTSPDVGPLPPQLIMPYLAVRSDLRSRDPERFKAAIEQGERILAEVDHPLLLASIAQLRVRLSFFTGTGFDVAKEISRRAVERAPALAEAHAAWALCAWQLCDATTAVRGFLKAIELDPGLADARLTLGSILAEIGAPAVGLRLMAEAVARVPSLHSAYFDSARIHVLIGRFDAAMASLSKLPPDSFMGAMSIPLRMRFAAWRNDREQVALLWEQARGIPRTLPAGAVIEVYGATIVDGVAPRKAYATHATPEEVDLPRRRRLFEAQAWFEVGMVGNDVAFAMEQLQRAVDFGLCDIIWLDRCPLFADLLGVPRFEAARDVVRERARAALALLR